MSFLTSVCPQTCICQHGGVNDCFRDQLREIRNTWDFFQFQSLAGMDRSMAGKDNYKDFQMAFAGRI